MRRRSFVLVSVLVLVAIAVLVVTGLLHLAQSETAALSNSGDAVRSRALAWSGVQAVMTVLDDQRRTVLAGDQPILDPQYTIYEAGGRLGIVRLLPLRPGGPLLDPEAAKLDLNHVDADMLADTGWVDAALAESIITHRDERGGYGSVGDLLEVEGVTPEMLLGPIDEIDTTDAARGVEADIVDRVDARIDGGAPRGLTDVLTVHGVGPALQQSGQLRINLNVPWSDELGRRLDDRFGDGASQIVRSIIDGGSRFDSEAVLYRVLREFELEPEAWPDIVDALTTDEGQFHFGRVDLNTASADVLGALPGLDPAIAEDIVATRDRLGAEFRGTVAWPAIEGLIEPEVYEQLAGHITTRSWTYRLRIAAGEVDRDEPEGPIDHPILYEVVIDLAGPTPRIAHLRDITMLQTTAMIALQATPSEEETDEVSEDLAERDDPAPPPAGAEPVDSEAADGDPASPRRIGRWHG